MLTIILQHDNQVVEDYRAEEKRANGVQAKQPGAIIQIGIEENPVDDVPHKKRFDHLDAGSEQGEYENRAHCAAMRPKPADIRAQVIAVLPAKPLLYRFLLVRRRLVDTGRLVIYSFEPIIAEEITKAEAGRARSSHTVKLCGIARRGQSPEMPFAAAERPLARCTAPAGPSFCVEEWRSEGVEELMGG